MKAPLRLAVFDIDGTLTEQTLATPLPGMLAAAGLCRPLPYARLCAYLRALPPDALEDAAVIRHAYQLYADMLRGVAVTAVESVVAEVWALRRRHVFDFAAPLLRSLQDRGHTVFLLSAGPDELVAHVQRHLHAPLALGTRLARADGLYTGRLHQTDSATKAALIRRHFHGAHVDWAASIAVGNSAADADLLSAVGRPVAFEPTPALRDTALRRRWTLADRTTLPRLLAPDTRRAR